MMITVYQLDECRNNERNGSYGGKAGNKEGIIFQGRNWIVKYPQSTRGMRKPELSYTTSPLSEFVGSQIYKMLGYDVHETILGVRNGKLVVGCKDFCAAEGALRELRTLKNVYNGELEEQLDRSFHSTGSAHTVDLEEDLIHLSYNPVLKNIPGIRERFWDCVVVDIWINNNDRNNGNWGLLYENGAYRIAPIYDNGACLSNKLSEGQMKKMLEHPERFYQSAMTSRTAFSIGDRELYARDLILYENPDLKASIQKNVPLIGRMLPEITRFIRELPESAYGISVCSEIQKDFFIQSLETRYEYLLVPELEKYQEKAPDMKYDFVKGKEEREFSNDLRNGGYYEKKACSVDTDYSDDRDGGHQLR